MEERSTNITLHTPEGMAYTCHSEGVCCHVFDTIPVDEHAAGAIKQLGQETLNHAAENDLALPVAVANPAGPPPTKIARKACGDCAMLTSDKLCAIHALAGETAKPRVCQDFPWRYVETPDGVYVGLSFVCPSVRANRGQVVAEQSQDLSQRYATSGSVREAQARVPLNGRITLRWSDYRALESGLQDLLTLESETLPVRLIAMCLLPGFIDQVIAQSGVDDGQRNSGSKTESYMVSAGAVDGIITAMRTSQYRHVLQVARKPTPSAARSRRMFLGMFTSFANTLHHRDKGRLRTVVGVMNQYVRHAAGIGTVVLNPLETQLNHTHLRSAIVPVDGYASDQITRYITHCIFRKDLVLSGDLTRRVRLLALNAALIPWYATAIAGAAGRPSLTDADWDEAIGHVERLYGFHSAFYKFFEQNKVFSDIVDSFILKPAYPFALFR